jgi:hypothetical protein
MFVRKYAGTNLKSYFVCQQMVCFGTSVFCNAFYVLDQGWATKFVRWPHWAFICDSRAKFMSNILIQAENGVSLGLVEYGSILVSTIFFAQYQRNTITKMSM